MTGEPAQTRPRNSPTWIAGSMAALAMAAYYLIFFFPPRLTGSSEPDRYYHLGLSRLEAVHGLLKSLPQVEDLNWGRYFPDKEFLFHALTGIAYWLGGPQGTLLLVPLLGIAISVCLYLELARILPPTRAALLVSSAMLLSPVLMYRLTLLRPHVLAILFFCFLLAGILRRRAWLAAVAAAGFALSYHAFYIPLIVIGAAAGPWLQVKAPGLRTWHWALIGLACGIFLNPYFPSTVLMSWIHVRVALGAGMPADIASGAEVQPLALGDFLGYFSLLPIAVLAAATVVLVKRLRPTQESAGFWFLLLLSAVLTLLSLRSSRAAEYAVPCAILLSGYTLRFLHDARWVVVACLLLAATQGHGAYTYYKDSWQRPQQGLAPYYLSALDLLPADAAGKKLFNCEWEAGSYILFARPDVRFVDLLEPALLWQASPEKYLARARLLAGEERNPVVQLVGTFKADYVICGTRALTKQLEADPRHFQLLPGSRPGNPVRLFRVEE